MNPPRQALSRADWQQLNRLLEQALGLPLEKRGAWLDGLQVEHARLTTVLRDLLTKPADTDSLVSGPSSAAAQVAADALADMRRDLRGDRIGPWRLVELLGTGGMGDVWKAERADGVMERTAALKLPRAEWVDRGLATRIARERSILARLQHPHIAVLYDAGVFDSGRPYLALEYVDGVTIDVFAQQQALDLRQRVRLLLPVIRAVAYAHSRLVVHRDIKPGNILVTSDGQPKLLDFGISKLLEADATAADQTALTRYAGRALTLAYAAPEQLLGQSIGVGTDVYALGVVLFELLTGRRPFIAADAHTLEQRIVHGEIPRPSDCAPDRARRAALRGDLDAILLRALRREPEQRYDSASALADDLERQLGGQPVRARPTSRAYRTRKLLRRHWLPTTAATLAGAALLAGASVALWQAGVARDQAAEAAMFNAFVLGLIQHTDPHASRETRAADVAMLSAIEQRIDSGFKGRPEQLLRLRLTVGDAYRNRGEAVAAQRVYARASDEARSRLPDDDLQVLTARMHAADPRLIVRTSAAAELDEVIDRLRTRGSAGTELLIEALLMRSDLRNTYGVPSFAPAGRRMDDLDDALALALRFFGKGSSAHLRVMLPYGWARWLFGTREEALELVGETLDAARERDAGVVTSPEYIAADTFRLGRLCLMKRSREAVADLWRLVDTARAAHGDSSVQLESLYAALAPCYEDLDDPSGRWLLGAAFDTALAREQPPSTQLLQRADAALNEALEWKRYRVVRQYYEAALQNAQAIADVPLRERLVRRLAMTRVCVLAYGGEAQASEDHAAALTGSLDEDFARLQRLAPRENWLWLCRSHAQRQLGRYDDAVRSAQTYLDRCHATGLLPRVCAVHGMVALALAQLDAGRPEEARVAMDARARTMPGGAIGINPDSSMARGRIRLATGQPMESVEHFRLAYGYWLASAEPRGVWAAEAEYWLGRAYLAIDDSRGPWMVKEARSVLADSPLGHHRRLAAQPLP